jgi:hypothetical protein
MKAEGNGRERLPVSAQQEGRLGLQPVLITDQFQKGPFIEVSSQKCSDDQERVCHDPR